MIEDCDSRVTSFDFYWKSMGSWVETQTNQPLIAATKYLLFYEIYIRVM